MHSKLIRFDIRLQDGKYALLGMRQNNMDPDQACASDVELSKL